MDRYNLQKVIGDGTYGSVLRAVNKKTHQTVAIKKMKKKFYSWDECVKLREVQSLKKLTHPNIVALKELIREKDELFFVFEYLERNVYEMTKCRKKFLSERAIARYVYQIVDALTHMHKHNFFHRDLKPENLLLSADNVIKVADFGLAREIRSRPPFTDYVSTRWYRAPEVLLRSNSYNSPVDLWAIGCIMAELYTFRPLFPGSSEPDQIYKVCSVLGSPTQKEWPDGIRLANAMGYSFPAFVPTQLAELIPAASKQAIGLMKDLLSWRPEIRPHAPQVLQYEFFSELSAQQANLPLVGEDDDDDDDDGDNELHGEEACVPKGGYGGAEKQRYLSPDHSRDHSRSTTPKPSPKSRRRSLSTRFMDQGEGRRESGGALDAEPSSTGEGPSIFGTADGFSLKLNHRKLRGPSQALRNSGNQSVYE